MQLHDLARYQRQAEERKSNVLDHIERMTDALGKLLEHRGDEHDIRDLVRQSKDILVQVLRVTEQGLARLVDAGAHAAHEPGFIHKELRETTQLLQKEDLNMTDMLKELNALHKNPDPAVYADLVDSLERLQDAVRLVIRLLSDIESNAR